MHSYVLYRHDLFWDGISEFIQAKFSAQANHSIPYLSLILQLQNSNVSALRPLTCFSPPAPSLLSLMPKQLIGLLKFAVLETASTWPGLLGSTSMALASESALDSSELARFFRRSFFRASTRATGEFKTLSVFMGVVVEGVGVWGCVVCGV